MDNEFNGNDLLKNGSLLNFFLHCEFDFNSLGMRLCPNETSICEAYICQVALEFLDQKRQQFPRLEISLNPRAWRLEVSIAPAAKVDH